MSGFAPVLIPVLTTILTAVILVALRYTAARIKENLEAQQQSKEAKDAQRAKDQWDLLTRIEAQTNATNGRVSKLEDRLDAVVPQVAKLSGGYEAIIAILPKGDKP